jgi:NAD+ synthase
LIDAKKEIENRTKWIKNLLKESGAKGVVFGASGGKDSVLVGILCKMAADNVTGIIMPCESSRNFNEDRLDALEINEKFGIETVEIDLTEIKRQFAEKLKPLCPEHSDMAYANINPRLRMIALYNYAQRKNYLVAGTGNRSERTMGYFTKWGDGACDFNPIADLTVREVYQLLRFLGVPQKIMEKAPSAGLFEGQTDEKDMGITYDEIDDYLLENKADDRVKEIIERAEKRTAHKRNNIIIYK